MSKSSVPVLKALTGLDPETHENRTNIIAEPHSDRHLKLFLFNYKTLNWSISSLLHVGIALVGMYIDSIQMINIQLSVCGRCFFSISTFTPTVRMSCIGRVSKDVFFSICFSHVLSLGNTKLAWRLGVAREGIGEINKLPSQCVGGYFWFLWQLGLPRETPCCTQDLLTI